MWKCIIKEVPLRKKKGGSEAGKINNIGAKTEGGRAKAAPPFLLNYLLGTMKEQKMPTLRRNFLGAPPDYPGAHPGGWVQLQSKDCNNITLP